eukprot:2538858-Prymnesium_polylepis.1
MASVETQPIVFASSSLRSWPTPVAVLGVVRVVRVVRQFFVIGPKYVHSSSCVCKNFSWGKVILPHTLTTLTTSYAKPLHQIPNRSARTKPRRACNTSSPLFNMPKGTKVYKCGDSGQ